MYDNVTYLASLGKAQTAAVKRDAEIGVAQVTFPYESRSVDSVLEEHTFADFFPNWDFSRRLGDNYRDTVRWGRGGGGGRSTFFCVLIDLKRWCAERTRAAKIKHFANRALCILHFLCTTEILLGDFFSLIYRRGIPVLSISDSNLEQSIFHRYSIEDTNIRDEENGKDTQYSRIRRWEDAIQDREQLTWLTCCRRTGTRASGRQSVRRQPWTWSTARTLR